MIVNQFEGIKVDGISCAVPNEWKSIEVLKNGENNEILDRFVKTHLLRVIMRLVNDKHHQIYVLLLLRS